MDSTRQRSPALFRSLSLDSKENQERKDKKEYQGDQDELALMERLVKLGSKVKKA